MLIDDCSGLFGKKRNRMLPNESRTCCIMPALNQVAVNRNGLVPILPVIGPVPSRLTVFEVSEDGTELSKYGILAIVDLK